MKKTHIFLFLLFVVTGMLEVANIYLSNTVTTDSINATRLQEKINMLDEENLNLKSSILKNSSFEFVASRAAEFGFKHNDSIVTLNTPIEVAAR